MSINTTANDLSGGQSSDASQQAKDHYPYTILHKITSFLHYFSSPSTTNNQSYLQDQKQDTATVKEKQEEIKDPFLKRILIVDDEPDLTLTFKVGLEGYYYQDNKKRRFEVYTYNDPLRALSEFKPHFYDLMLVDVYMPDMSGFQLCEKILEVDPNLRVCFISAAEININALREVYPKLSFGCFIKKPVTIEYLVRRLLAELD
jgi:CheY-like chemotaxis protein